MAFMFLPRVVIRLPAVLQKIKEGEVRRLWQEVNYTYQFLPTEVAADQIRLVVSSTAVEASLGHLLRSAGTVRLEGPVLERLESRFILQHLAVIFFILLPLLHVVTYNSIGFKICKMAK